jgi:large conductance mechanosensitive channel
VSPTRDPYATGRPIVLKGFRDFLLRGNIIELAVAFVIGVAFAAVVTSFVDNLIMPIVGKLGGEPDFSSIDIAGIPVGAFINDVVAFVIIAAAVYFLVVAPFDRIQDLRKKDEPEEAEQLEETVVLLREIRDALTRSGSEGTST